MAFCLSITFPPQSFAPGCLPHRHRQEIPAERCCSGARSFAHISVTEAFQAMAGQHLFFKHKATFIVAGLFAHGTIDHWKSHRLSHWQQQTHRAVGGHLGQGRLSTYWGERPTASGPLFQPLSACLQLKQLLSSEWVDAFFSQGISGQGFHQHLSRIAAVPEPCLWPCGDAAAVRWAPKDVTWVLHCLITPAMSGQITARQKELQEETRLRCT